MEKPTLNLGDVNYLEYGGFFVWDNGEIERLEVDGDFEDTVYTVGMIDLGTLRGALNESDAASIAISCDHATFWEDLHSDEIGRWSHAALSALWYWGFWHLGGSEHCDWTEAEIQGRYGDWGKI